jgi:hypothetical protein
MSKTDTPNDHRPDTPLADRELDAVTGGLKFDTEVTDFVRAVGAVDTQFDLLASC